MEVKVIHYFSGIHKISDNKYLVVNSFPLSEIASGGSVPEDNWQVVQNADGSITIKSTTQTDDIFANYKTTYDLSAYTLQDVLGNNTSNYFGDDKIVSSFIDISGANSGATAFNATFKDGDGTKTYNCVTDNENGSITISAYAFMNLGMSVSAGTYSIQFKTSDNIWHTVENVHLNPLQSSYKVSNGDGTSLVYGFYIRNENGTLMNCFDGDDVSNLYEYTRTYSIGVASYKDSNHGNTADGTPDASEFAKIHIVDFKALDSSFNSTNKIHLEKINTTLGEISTEGLEATLSDDCIGTFYVFAYFTIGEVTDNAPVYCAYKKVIFNPVSETTYNISLKDKTDTEIINELSVFSSWSNLSEKYNDITQAKTVREEQTYIFNLTDVPDRIVDGNIVFNILCSGSDCNEMDFNSYTINANGLTISGSFENTGNTVVNLEKMNFRYDSEKSTKTVAINAVCGDINVDNCNIDGYEVGIKSSALDTKTGYKYAGFIPEVLNTTMQNCGVGISLEATGNYTGNNYRVEYYNNIFVNCGTAFKTTDLMTCVNPYGMYLEENLFISGENTVADFDITHTTRNTNEDEYYIFPNNYFGSVGNDGVYRTPIIKTSKGKQSGDVKIATSPAKMFPESTVCEYGVDNKALTAFLNGRNYEINSLSDFTNAIAVTFDQTTGKPTGTSILKKKAV